MAVQSNDMNTDKIKKPGPDVFGKKERVKERPSDNRTDDVNTNYGFSNGAELDTGAEETEDQEYMADGLPRTQKYSIDKVGRSHDMPAREGHDGQSDRKGRSDCGC